MRSRRSLHRLSKNVSHLPPGRLFPVQSHQWLNGKILLSRSRAMSAMAGVARARFWVVGVGWRSISAMSKAARRKIAQPQPVILKERPLLPRIEAAKLAKPPRSPSPSLGIPLHSRSSQNGVGFSELLRYHHSLRRPSFAAALWLDRRPQARLVSLSSFRRVHSVHVRRRFPFHWLGSPLQSSFIRVHQR